MQFIFRLKKFNFHTGIRYDHNSIYGGSVNPRISTIYKFSKKGAVKLIYAEAFQEPPPVQLWGGWLGRQANPDLKPEKARNIELVGMLQTGKFLHDLSLLLLFMIM